MAYIISWGADPSDSTLAKDIDNEIVKLKDALEERLEDVLITDIDADPWVLKPAVTGQVSGLEEWIPFHAWKSGAGGNDPGFTNAPPIFYQDNAASWGFAVMLPRGSTITKIDIVARIPATGGSTCKLYHVDRASTAASWVLDNTLNLSANNNALFNLYTASGLAIVVGAAWYSIFIACGTADRFLGAVITYDRPSHLVG